MTFQITHDYTLTLLGLRGLHAGHETTQTATAPFDTASNGAVAVCVEKNCAETQRAEANCAETGPAQK